MQAFFKDKNKLLAVILSAVFILSLTAFVITLFPSRAEAAAGYSFEIINFTPDKVTVSANKLHDENGGGNVAVSFSNKDGFEVASGKTLTSDAIFETVFKNTAKNYVVGAILAPSSIANTIKSRLARGKTFKEVYIEYYKTLGQKEIEAFRPMAMVGGDTYSDYSYSFGINSDGYNLLSGGVVIVTGAFPADDKAISITANATDIMKIGNNHAYADNMKVNATVINNASYPILISTKMEGENLVKHNPDNLWHNGMFHLDTVSDSLDRSGEFFIAPGGVVRRSVEFNTCYYNNAKPYYGPVLNTALDDIAEVTTTVNNITYAVSGQNGLAQSECKLEVTTETVFPAEDYEISTFIQWQTRPALTSVSPGMIGISDTRTDGVYSNSKTCLTGLKKNGTFDLSFSGKNMDRVQRIVIAPRAGQGGHALSNKKYLKTAITYTNVEGKWTVLNNGGSGDTSGWWYKIRPISKRTSSSITISINAYDIYGLDDSRENWNPDRIMALNKAFHQDSFNKTPDYLDIYVLSAGEEEKPVQTTQWAAGDPKVIRDRTADFSLPLSHTASSGAAYVSSDGSKVGGSYLAIVPATIVNGKPNSKRMTVTNQMTGTQQLYKAIMFTGVGSEITATKKTGETTWKMTANNGIKVNEYLRIVPDAPNNDAYITIEEVGTTITIKSENCKLYAGDKQLFFDFYSVLDDINKKYWYSNSFEKVSSEAASQSAQNKYDEKTGAWLKGARLYGTDIKPADMHKIKFLPMDKDSGGLYFDASVIKGGVTAAYPYIDEVGLEMELQTLTFLPQFIREFLVMDDWNKTLAEVRYPFSGDMPQISTGGPIELAIGGNFMVFSLGATACLEINTLWEERNIFGVSGSVNLFNKIQVDATIILREFGNAGMVPDEVAFSLGSDVIGLIPPVPFLQISSLGGAITGIGSNTINKTWRDMPTPDIRLEIGGEIGIPHTQIDIGFDKAYLTLGLNRLEIGLEKVSIGPVVISEYLLLNYAGDFTSEVELPGTDGFKLPMPVFNISGKGQIGLSVTKYLSRIINAEGDFSFTFDSGVALQSFFNTINTNTDSFKKNANAIKVWVKEHGSDDMISIMGLLKNIGFDYVKLMKDTAVNVLNSGALKVTASVEGSIKVPENIPHFGGKVLAGGSVSLLLYANLLIIDAEGELLGESITAGFGMSWDITKGIGAPNISLMSYNAGGSSSGYTVYTTNLEDKTASSSGGSGGIKVVPLSLTQLSTSSQLSLTVAEGETTILLSFDVPSKTAVTITSSNGDEITVQADDTVAWTALYDRNNDGWIDEEEEAAEDAGNAYAYRFNYLIKNPGEVGTEWTISGEGITGVDSANVLPTEKVSNVTYAPGGTVTFDFANPKQGTGYSYELFLVDGSGTKYSAAIGLVSEGLNEVTIPLELFKVLQSGQYYALVTVCTIDDNPKPIPSQGISTALDYTNSAAPQTPTIANINYAGDGSYQVDITDKDVDFGYEVRITGENNFELISDYSSSDIFVGTGLSANKAYTVYVRAYVISNGRKIFGQESVGVGLTPVAASPAEVDVGALSVQKNSDDGVYYAALNQKETAVDADIVFTSACKSYTITIMADNSATAIVFEEETAALSYTWKLDLNTAARYTVIITTVNELGDSGRYTFNFVVDGESPRLLIDQDSVVFDGTNLSFYAYLEPGAQILDADMQGTWTYDIASASERAEKGNYFGTWVGTVNVLPKDVTKTPDEGESATIAVVYEITVTASDFAGNQTEILLMITAESTDALGAQQLILNTNGGNKLALGMTDISLLASVIVAPSFTEKSVGIELLKDLSSSDTSVITIDVNGNITIVGKGNATLSASYEDGTKTLTAVLKISVADVISMEVTVEDYTQDSATLLLPALPGFSGSLEVRSQDQLIMTLTQGFDEVQLLTIEDLIGDSVICLVPTGNTAYAETRIYLSAQAVCDCTKCQICGGCTEDVCCGAEGCTCEPCTGHTPSTSCECAKCAECGGCTEDVCCEADDCTCTPCDCEDDPIITPPASPKNKLSGGQIAGIAVGGGAVAAIAGFAIFWFAIKKRTFADIAKIFKKTPKE